MEIPGPVSSVLQLKPGSLWSIGPGATVYEAISLMSEKNIGAILVMDGNRLAGIFTERDYTRKLILRGRASKDTRIADVLSSEILTITPSTTVQEAMRLMTDNRIRHLPVLDNDRVVGLVSIGDLVKWTISAQSAAIEHLQSYITGQTP
jgi:CBS domain-containing protein